MRWNDWPLAIADTETTGVDTETARIWEIAIRYDGASPAAGQSVSVLVNPGCEIPEVVVEKCHLTKEDLRAIADAAPFSEVAGRLLERLDGHVVVGHNIMAYDLPLIRKELERAGAAPEGPWPARFIDSVVWARHVLARIRCKHKLEDLAPFMGYAPDAHAHRAATDCWMTGAVLWELAGRIPDDLDVIQAEQERLLPLQREDFDRYGWWLQHDRAVEGEPLVIRAGKHIGTPLDLVRPSYLRWLLNAAKTWDPPLTPATEAAFRDVLERGANRRLL